MYISGHLQLLGDSPAASQVINVMKKNDGRPEHFLTFGTNIHIKFPATQKYQM